MTRGSAAAFPRNGSQPIALERSIAPEQVRARRARRHLGRTRRLYFIGSDAQLRDLRREVALHPGLELAGHSGLGSAAVAGRDYETIARATPSVLVLCDEAIRDSSVVKLASRLNLDGVCVRDLRGFYEEEFDKVALAELTPSWFLFDIAEIHRHAVYGRVKRVVETVFAAALLLAMLPLFPLFALGIKLASPGPVFFRQRRIGRGGKPFFVTKFRTMHPDPDHENGFWADDGTARTFPLGRALRTLRLDELPQLWHILRGELSLVGPRPEQPAIVERLERSMEFYAARHSVRPGLTGWAQVNCGYAGSYEGALTKLQYDLFYVKHQSLVLDLRIMAATARAILAGGEP